MDPVTRFFTQECVGPILQREANIEVSRSRDSNCPMCCLNIEYGVLRIGCKKVEQGKYKKLEYSCRLHLGCFYKAAIFETWDWNLNPSYQSLSKYPALKEIVDTELHNVGSQYGVVLSRDPRLKDIRARAFTAQQNAECLNIADKTVSFTEQIVDIGWSLFERGGDVTEEKLHSHGIIKKTYGIARQIVAQNEIVYHRHHNCSLLPSDEDAGYKKIEMSNQVVVNETSHAALFQGVSHKSKPDSQVLPNLPASPVPSPRVLPNLPPSPRVLPNFAAGVAVKRLNAAADIQFRVKGKCAMLADIKKNVMAKYSSLVGTLMVTNLHRSIADNVNLLKFRKKYDVSTGDVTYEFKMNRYPTIVSYLANIETNMEFFIAKK